MISFSVSGNTQQTEAFLRKAARGDYANALDSAAQQGVTALSAATPKESARAAQSWSYEITRSTRGVTITWINNDIENGFPVAIMLQYGYGTGTGGFVQGRDYINPAMKPIFDRISEQVRKAVSTA